MLARVPRGLRRLSQAVSQAPGAGLIDGAAAAQDIRQGVAAGAAELIKTKGVAPGLGVVLVGDRSDSRAYVRVKLRQAKQAGLHTVDVRLGERASQEEVLNAVYALNANSAVHGVIVQLPLPAHVDEKAVLKRILPEKDADGLSVESVAALRAHGAEEPAVVACTPKACIELLDRHNIDIEGKRAVVLGRSDIVGNPMAALLLKRHATVTVAHSRTPDVADVVSTADIVVSSVGRPGFVRGSWLKPGCVVLDVGINAVEDAAAPRGYRLVGDVADDAWDVASLVSPVPGGVGPVTVAMLLANTLTLARRAVVNTQRRAFSVAAHTNDEPPSETPSDIEISQRCVPRPITDVGAALGLMEDEIISWGWHKAKVDAPRVHARLGAAAPRGSLVVVCGINPTPLGEGKSTAALGLSQALGAHLGKRVVTTIRQPSQGPTFGIKGGAAGGGYSQVIPMEEFNLHMTGDIHAIVAANNLVAAALDARMFHEAKQTDQGLFKRLIPEKDGKRVPAASQRARLERLGVTGPALDDAELMSAEDRVSFARLDVDPSTITWNRVLDTCDRFLRRVETGKGPSEAGFGREAGFDIAVASEIMAVLALAEDAQDMRERLGRMVVGRSRADGPHEGGFVTVDDLGVAGALAVLMKDAALPTLMQSLEGTPVLVHAGPFANIAHGASSIIADKVGLKLVGAGGFVVTEAGFGADIGGEKFFDIKCRAGDLKPKCAVVVATVRALKLHGGAPPVVAGRPLPKEYRTEDLDLLERGCANLEHHVRCLTNKFGIPVVVAVNKFADDMAAELNLVCARALSAGARAAVPCSNHADGGTGAVDLAEAVVTACENDGGAFRYLYPTSASVRDKVEAVCKEIYLAGEVTYSDLASHQITAYEAQGLGDLPICIAKTQYSLSTDPSKKGAPSGHVVNVREVRASVGAGFLYLLCGDIMTVPGLPTRPGFVDVDMDADGDRVIGLF